MYTSESGLFYQWLLDARKSYPAHTIHLLRYLRTLGASAFQLLALPHFSSGSRHSFHVESLVCHREARAKLVI